MLHRKQKLAGYHSRVDHVLAQQGLSGDSLQAHGRSAKRLLQDAALSEHGEALSKANTLHAVVTDLRANMVKP